MTRLFIPLLILTSTFSCVKQSRSSKQIKEQETVMSLSFHYLDSFSSEEKQKLESWIAKVAHATELTFGEYPFTTHVYFKRSSAALSAGPVPWAFTKRSPSQQAHFHVNTVFTEEEFLADWTAPHELSHLSIPFVGKSNSWFAEGYASFMQYQVMHSLGILSADEVSAKYAEKFDMHLPYFKGFENDIARRAMELRKDYNFPAMYWGGAYYFFKMDSIWKQNNTSLIEVIQAYQQQRPKATYQKFEQIEKHWQQLADSLMNN